MGHGTLLFNWHIFLNDVLDFNFHMKSPERKMLVFFWRLTSFVAELLLFVSYLAPRANAGQTVSHWQFFSREV